MKYFKSIYNFFDKLEDKVRARLSKYPILYAFVGGVGVVIFWRGIWHTTDFFTQAIVSFQQNSTIDLNDLTWWDGPVSIIVGSVLLLSTGLFVFDFLGSETIIKRLRGEEKITERTEEEVKAEEGTIQDIKEGVKEISQKLEEIEQELKEENNK